MSAASLARAARTQAALGAAMVAAQSYNQARAITFLSKGLLLHHLLFPKVEMSGSRPFVPQKPLLLLCPRSSGSGSFHTVLHRALAQRQLSGTCQL